VLDISPTALLSLKNNSILLNNTASLSYNFPVLVVFTNFANFLNSSLSSQETHMVV
jgi:hypothetical protein